MGTHDGGTGDDEDDVDDFEDGSDDLLMRMRMTMTMMMIIIEGSLEVKLPTIWTDEMQSREEAERRERLEERRVRRKKMQMRDKIGKSRNTVFFQ